MTAEVFVYRTTKLLETLENLVESDKEKNSNSDDEGATLKDFGHRLLPQLVSEGRAREFRLKSYWRDLGTIESYWQGHMDLLADAEGLALDDAQWPILTYGTQRTPARIYETARVDNSLISSGCTIRGRVERSVLAPGVHVAEGATVRDSILLYNVRVESGATVDCAVLDDLVEVGGHASIGQQLERATQHKNTTAQPDAIANERITLVGRKVKIANGASVEVGARVKPLPAEDE